MPKTPYTVALTGGVASGKSTVAARFAALGVPVIDADIAARHVVAPGSDGLNAVIGEFGMDAMGADGGLDRAWMRRHVFADDAARERLEAILHPRIRQRLRAEVGASQADWVLLALPLLAESWPDYDWVDRVLVVDLPEATQLERLMRRDDVDQAMARRMLAAQASRQQRRQIADDIIDNRASIEALGTEVRRLAEDYAARAAARQERGP